MIRLVQTLRRIVKSGDESDEVWPEILIKAEETLSKYARFFVLEGYNESFCFNFVDMLINTIMENNEDWIDVARVIRDDPQWFTPMSEKALKDEIDECMKNGRKLDLMVVQLPLNKKVQQEIDLSDSEEEEKKEIIPTANDESQMTVNVQDQERMLSEYQYQYAKNLSQQKQAAPKVEFSDEEEERVIPNRREYNVVAPQLFVDIPNVSPAVRGRQGLQRRRRDSSSSLS